MSKAHVMKDGFYKVTNGLQPITKVKDHVMYSKDYRFDTDMTIDIEYGKVYLSPIPRKRAKGKDLMQQL